MYATYLGGDGCIDSDRKTGCCAWSQAFALQSLAILSFLAGLLSLQTCMHIRLRPTLWHLKLVPVKVPSFETYNHQSL